jgi:hydroxyethylthiazole kinase
VTRAAPVTAARAAALLAQVRERRPLIHHITNFVTAGDVANVTLALGASPVMARAVQEVEDVAAQAAAVVLNTGTLTADGATAMILAGSRANGGGIPVVLDPVGAGATTFRTQRITRILQEVRCACVRGNAGEIATLAGRPGRVRGVDASGTVDDIEALARRLAQHAHAAIAATGREDVVTDGATSVRIVNGHPFLAAISGSGCMATAAIAAAAAVEPDPLAAAVAGLLWFEVAAEEAAAQAAGPGTFRTALVDAVAALDGRTIEARARIVVR